MLRRAHVPKHRVIIFAWTIWTSLWMSLQLRPTVAALKELQGWSITLAVYGDFLYLVDITRHLYLLSTRNLVTRVLCLVIDTYSIHIKARFNSVFITNMAVIYMCYCMLQCTNILWNINYQWLIPAWHHSTHPHCGTGFSSSTCKQCLSYQGASAHFCLGEGLPIATGYIVIYDK